MMAALMIHLSSSCLAADPRCSTPPYGGTVQEFQSFVKHFGSYVTPSKFLSSICEVKYGGADRTPMYNLGFTDRDIENKPLADLWVEVISAVHDLAKQSK